MQKYSLKMAKLSPSVNNMENVIVIGKIVAPHGVRGDIRILPLTDNPEQFLKLAYLLLPSGDKLTLERARFHKNMVLISAAEIKSMDAAEALRGKEVSIYRKDLPKIGANRFYVSDLIGLPVYDETGKQLGVFKDALPTGKVDAYVIATPDGKEILVAAIADNIKEINIPEKKIIVHLPEWEEVK